MLHKAARRARYEVRRLPLRVRGQHRVNAGGTGVVGFIDVGSMGALPAPWDEHPYSIRRLLKFEPLARRSTDPDVTTLDVAVWEQDEERDFYVYEAAHGSSLYPQNVAYVREHFETLRQRGPSELAESWFARSGLSQWTVSSVGHSTEFSRSSGCPLTFSRSTPKALSTRYSKALNDSFESNASVSTSSCSQFRCTAASRYFRKSTIGSQDMASRLLTRRPRTARSLLSMIAFS